MRIKHNENIPGYVLPSHGSRAHEVRRRVPWAVSAAAPLCRGSSCTMTDLGSPSAPRQRVEKRPAGWGRAGAGRPTPIIFEDVGDGHDYHSGDQLSFPYITDRRGLRRYAGEPARARRSLRRRRKLLLSTLRGQLGASHAWGGGSGAGERREARQRTSRRRQESARRSKPTGRARRQRQARQTARAPTGHGSTRGRGESSRVNPQGCCSVHLRSHRRTQSHGAARASRKRGGATPQPVTRRPRRIRRVRATRKPRRTAAGRRGGAQDRGRSSRENPCK